MNVSSYKYFLYVAILFVAVLMVSNTVASKLISIGPFVLPGAIFLFPISYIFGDILTEVYGYAASRRIIWSGFAALIFMSFAYYFVQHLPSAPFWANQGAYEAILGVVPRVVLGSIVGFLVGEFANSILLSKMKIWTQGSHLWMRTIGSTIVGEGLDTMLFILIAFWGILPGGALFTLLWSSYFAKVAFEVIATPITYAVVRWLKKVEGVDTFDIGVNYSPFLFGKR